MPSDEQLVSQSVRTMQIIVAALVAGVMAFTLYLLFTGHEEQAANPQGQSLAVTTAAAAAFVVAVLLRLVVPGRIAAGQVAQIAAGTWPPAAPSSAPRAVPLTDTGKLLIVFQTKTIVANAILEAPAFLAGTAYMNERQPLILIVVAAAVLMMVGTFPTRSRVEQWLAAQQQRIDETRQFG